MNISANRSLHSAIPISDFRCRFNGTFESDDSAAIHKQYGMLHKYTRRFAPRAASAGGFYTLSQGRALSKMRANEAGREVHDFRCKLTTCKCQELHAPGKQSWPRACTQYVERAERKSSAVFFTEIGTKKGKSFAHHTAALCCCLRSVRIIHINIGCVLS